MKRLLKSLYLLTAVALLAVGCKKDDDPTITFEVSALFLTPGQTLTIPFKASSEISTFSVTGTPSGWDDATVTPTARTITVTAPSSFGENEEGKTVARSGTFILTGSYGTSSSVTARLFATVCDVVDFGEHANSYLAKAPITRYSFDAMHRPDGAALATASVRIVWQSRTSLLEYVDFENGRATFYVGVGTDDAFREGNALLGAYDKDDNLLWTWHVWASEYDLDAPESTIEINGRTVMSRNLGALACGTGSGAEILGSFGLYYQWGRKEPFVGPANYYSGSSISGSVYDADGLTQLEYVASDAKTGTMEYALGHPLTFITADQHADWFKGSSSTPRWGATKTLYDPCPYGWRVATAETFAGLTIKNDLTVEDAASLYAEQYGWTLGNDEAEMLFMGAGYRTYLNGLFSNIYDNLPVRSDAIYMQPWVGYYWMAEGGAGGDAPTFHFWFDKSAPTNSGVQERAPMGRSNGMPVRCIRE